MAYDRENRGLEPSAVWEKDVRLYAERGPEELSVNTKENFNIGLPTYFLNDETFKNFIFQVYAVQQVTSPSPSPLPSYL